MATVVVCDNDAVVRASVSAVCAEAGLEVVAETDSGTDATELMRRFDVDVLVLDLSLSDGSGERALTILDEASSKAAVVVFSAYARDPDRLYHLGAREVIEKPDFARLAHVLTGLGSSLDKPVDHPDDRRLASREVDRAPKMWCSPAGVSPHHDLTHSLLTLEVGDAVLAVTVVGLEALEADVGPLLTADCRLAVAGIVRDELRIQDLLHEAPEIAGFVALLRGGDARTAGAVWSRVTEAVRGVRLPGEVKGAASRVDAMGAKDAVAKAIGALKGTVVGGTEFLRV